MLGRGGTNSSGIYIHIPFCVKKCSYCDFNSFDNIEHLYEPYTDALLAELAVRLPYDYDTVFIGGGTPTALPLPLLLRAVGRVAKNGCEFTVEVNPATIDKEGFARLRAAGVNRISLGLQSADDAELKTLGRIHDYSAFLNTYSAARGAGFDNINVDLMFSLPNQTADGFLRTLEKVVALSPEHLSCYSLILEEGTPLFDANPALPDEDEDREMYVRCVDYLKKHGYEHYEISNFSKPGFECRHNLKYWNRDDYYGMGAGAHSLVGGVRYANTTGVEEYIKGNNPSSEPLTAEDEEREFIFLGLRKTEGIDLALYRALFGQDFLQRRSRAAEKYRAFCEVENGFFRLNLDGISVSNVILSELTE